MKNNIKKLFLTSRPISWVNTAYPFAAGYLLLNGQVDALFIIATLYFLIPYNLLMYGINDVFDYESDIKNPRKGGLEGAVTAKKFHPIIIKASVFLNLPFLIAMVILGGSLSASLILALVVFFVIAYSIGGLRFKEKPILDSVTSSMHFVGPLLYAVALANFPPETFPYLLAFFLWGMASHAFGAVQDIAPDREANISSVATVLGARSTVNLAIIFYIACVIIIALQGGMASIVALALMAYPANLLPFINVTDSTSSRTRKGWRRFMKLNYFVGFVITIVLIFSSYIFV